MRYTAGSVRWWLMMLIILFLCPYVDAAGAGQAGGGQAGGGKAAGQIQQFTGDLCNGDASNALDPDAGQKSKASQSFTSKFDPECATCVKSAMMKGEYCRQGSWSMASRCECTHIDFKECSCHRRPTPFAIAIWAGLPAVSIFLILLWRNCIAKKSCPIYKWEKEYQEYIKEQNAEEDKERKKKGLPSLADEAKRKEKEEKKKKTKKKKKERRRSSAESESGSDIESDDSTATRKRKRKKKRTKKRRDSDVMRPNDAW